MNYSNSASAMGDRGRLFLSAFLFAIISAFYLPAAGAQTLNDQYQFYLVDTPTFSSPLCTNLGVVRDSNSMVVPGQFGPNLTAFCNYAFYSALGIGFPAGDATGSSGGTVTAGSTTESGGAAGGGAGAGASRGQGAREDAALRRRRERLRNNDSGTQPEEPRDNDFDIATFGGFNVFLSLDFQREIQKPTQFEGGRHSHSLDTTLGTDYRFGTKGLLGVALKYGAQAGDIDSGGNFNIHNNGIWTYGSWLPFKNFFLDLAAGVDDRSISTQRSVSMSLSRTTVTNGGFSELIETIDLPQQTAASDTHSHEASAELRTGYDFSFAGVTIGPRFATTFKHSSTDAFVENGPTAMTLTFDAQTSTSLRSIAGLQMSKAVSLGHAVWVPQFNADWVHEYRDDQHIVTAHFTEDLRSDPTQLHFLNQQPDRDWLQLRLNTVIVIPHGVSAFVAIESMVGHAYIERYRASVGVRVEL